MIACRVDSIQPIFKMKARRAGSGWSRIVEPTESLRTSAGLRQICLIERSSFRKILFCQSLLKNA